MIPEAFRTMAIRTWPWGLCIIAAACGGANPADAGAADPLRLRTIPEEQQASPADNCTTDNLPNFYRQGVKKGQNVVDKLWKKMNSCAEVEDLADQVSASLAEIELLNDSEDKLKKRCRYAGSIDGLLTELDTIQAQCDELCFMNGEFVGKIESKAYCDLAIEANGDLDVPAWIRGPVRICGLDFELACDSEFMEATAAYSNAVGECAPYTRDSFFEIWDRSRLKGCDYNNNSQN
jgi:hypothetical protein